MLYGKAYFGVSSQYLTEGIEINPLNAELNPICHLLAILGPHHILHINRIRVKGNVVP
jgi:hypothetical protein